MNNTKKHGITPEKRRLYGETKRRHEAEMRRLRNEEKRTGRKHTRRLAFIEMIIRSFGQNIAGIAALCGMSQQNLHWHFSVKDDIKLSMAERILGVLGLELKVEMKPLGPIPDKSGVSALESLTNRHVKIRIEADEFYRLPDGNPYLPDCIRKCPEESRMHFLARHLVGLGFGITMLSQEVLGMDAVSVKNIFSHDDIKVSLLMNIAERTNSEITWVIRRVAPE